MSRGTRASLLKKILDIWSWCTQEWQVMRMGVLAPPRLGRLSSILDTNTRSEFFSGNFFTYTAPVQCPLPPPQLSSVQDLHTLPRLPSIRS